MKDYLETLLATQVRVNAELNAEIARLRAVMQEVANAVRGSGVELVLEAALKPKAKNGE
jgi:hypothetical protein